MAKLILFLSLIFIFGYSASSDVLVNQEPTYTVADTSNPQGQVVSTPLASLPTIQETKGGTKGGLFTFWRKQQQPSQTVASDDLERKRVGGIRAIFPWNWHWSSPTPSPSVIPNFQPQRWGWGWPGGSKRNDLSGLTPCWCINQPISYAGVATVQQPGAGIVVPVNDQGNYVSDGNVRQVPPTIDYNGFATNLVPTFAPAQNGQPQPQPPVQKRGSVSGATNEQSNVQTPQPQGTFNFNPNNHQPDVNVGQNSQTQATKH